MGVPGMVLAPVALHFIKVEAEAIHPLLERRLQRH